jgi:hypothetical protein
MENQTMDSLIINEKPGQYSVGAAVVLQQRQNLPKQQAQTMAGTSATNLQVYHLYIKGIWTN